MGFWFDCKAISYGPIHSKAELEGEKVKKMY